ncbi:unnamed protein product [Leptosia nina]|uniref:Uncharacterized protein n=1 Tax=Leptosia nina TaxID=320188 RepID=A0AAV1JLA1_9NEOP
MASFSHQETQSSPAKELPRTPKCSGGSPHRERRRREEEPQTTGFSGALHRTPPPPPPALLRRLGVKEPTGVGKFRVRQEFAENKLGNSYVSGRSLPSFAR